MKPIPTSTSNPIPDSTLNLQSYIRVSRSKGPGLFKRLFGPWPEPVVAAPSLIEHTTLEHENIGPANLPHYVFRNVTFNHVVFTGVHLPWVQFIDCKFDHCSWSWCDLNWGRFIRCTLTACIFKDSQLQWVRADPACVLGDIQLLNTTHSPNTAPAFSRNPGEWSDIELDLEGFILSHT
jgi:hypothetical protein